MRISVLFGPKKQCKESLRLRRLSHAPKHLVRRLCWHDMVAFRLALATAAAGHRRPSPLSGAVFALRAIADLCSRRHGGRARHRAADNDNGSREKGSVDYGDVVRDPVMKVGARDSDAVARLCAKLTCGIQVAAARGALLGGCWTGPAEKKRRSRADDADDARETKRFQSLSGSPRS